VVPCAQTYASKRMKQVGKPTRVSRRFAASYRKPTWNLDAWGPPPRQSQFADNVHWVHEAPELTAGQRGVSTANNLPATFHSLRWQGRAKRPPHEPFVIGSCAPQTTRPRRIALPKRPPARTWCRRASGGIGAEHRPLARASRERTPARSSRRRTAAAAVTNIPFAHVR
jgi:hypothetical protein